MLIKKRLGLSKIKLYNHKLQTRSCNEHHPFESVTSCNVLGWCHVHIWFQVGANRVKGQPFHNAVFLALTSQALKMNRAAASLVV